MNVLGENQKSLYLQNGHFEEGFQQVMLDILQTMALTPTHHPSGLAIPVHNVALLGHQTSHLVKGSKLWIIAMQKAEGFIEGILAEYTANIEA